MPKRKTKTIKVWAVMDVKGRVMTYNWCGVLMIFDSEQIARRTGEKYARVEIRVLPARKRVRK